MDSSATNRTTQSDRYTINNAVDDLVTVVERYQQAGKTLKAAGLKPELQRKSEGRFNERDLGFATFGDFLRAAALKTDLCVVGKGTELAIAIERDADDQRSTDIKRDLWVAFMNWEESHVSFWSKSQQRAIRVPLHAGVDSSDPSPEMQAMLDQPDEYYRIEPATREDQEQWMRSFADEQDEPWKTALTAVLDSEKPISRFVALVKTDAGLLAGWYPYLRERVEERIREWFAPIDPEAPVLASESESPRVHGSLVSGSRSGAGQLRQLVMAAVERMSDEELRALSLPVGSLFDALP